MIKLTDYLSISEIEIAKGLKQNGIRPTQEMISTMITLIEDDVMEHEQNYEKAIKLGLKKDFWIALMVDYCLGKALELKKI